MQKVIINRFYSWNLFYVAYFMIFFFFKLKILVNNKKFPQVAILKVEHCGFLHLVAYLYLHKTLWFIVQISNSFDKNCKIKLQKF